MSKDIIVRIFMQPDQIARFISEIVSSKALDHLRYAIEEGGAAIDVPEETSFFEKLVSSKSGFFLCSDQISISVSPARDGWEVLATDTDDSTALRMIDVSKTYKLDFGFASQWKELEYRNLIRIKTQYGEEEAWVGRDFHKYLPGIYWITIIPKEWVADPAELIRVCPNTITTNHNFVIVAHELSGEWESNVPKTELAEFLSVQLFDKRIVEDSIDGSESFLELSEKLEAWP